MSNITIPPEALEAGKDTAFVWLRSHMEDDARVREMTDEELTELVSAACIAMLRAWPGMEHLAATSLWISGGEVHLPERINLPLTENSNDKG